MLILIIAFVFFFVWFYDSLDGFASAFLSFLSTTLVAFVLLFLSVVFSGKEYLVETRQLEPFPEGGYVQTASSNGEKYYIVQLKDNESEKIETRKIKENYSNLSYDGTVAELSAYQEERVGISELFLFSIRSAKIHIHLPENTLGDSLIATSSNNIELYDPSPSGTISPITVLLCVLAASIGLTIIVVEVTESDIFETIHDWFVKQKNILQTKRIYWAYKKGNMLPLYGRIVKRHYPKLYHEDVSQKVKRMDAELAIAQAKTEYAQKTNPALFNQTNRIAYVIETAFPCIFGALLDSDILPEDFKQEVQRYFTEREDVS